MSRNHLIPTSITNVKGVQTTVYRRPDSGSGKVSAALKAPQKRTGFMENLKAEAASVVFDDGVESTYANAGKIRAQVEEVLDNASAEQLRNIKEAMIMVRERDGDPDIRDWEIRAMKTLVRTGAHSTIAIAVQRYDEVPEGKKLVGFAVKETGKELLRIMHPVAMDDDKKLLKSLGNTSPDHIEHLRRAVHKAQTADGGSGGMFMDALESSLTGSASEVAYLYGMYANAIPDSIPPNRAVRTIKALFREGIVKIDGDDKILTAHLQAADQFERIKLDTSSSDFVPGRGTTYMDSPKLLAGVIMYPDRVNDLMAYRKERQAEDFDTDHFREYLGSGVMKEGML